MAGPLSPRSGLLSSLVVAGGSGVPAFATFLAGEWVSVGDGLLDIRSPVDGSIVARVVRPSWSQVDEALERIYRRGRWEARDTPGWKRLRILSRMADLMARAEDDFAEALVLTVGKTWRQARAEVGASIERLEAAHLDLRRVAGDYIPGDWSEHTLESEAIVRREPYGVVLAVIPFNYPLFDAVNKLVYSFIPGNAVVLKPPSQSPIPAIYLARLALEAGFPGEALAVATLPGRESGRLVEDSRLSVISLTGSWRTGVEVMRRAGVKQLLMELGGGDPAIVLRDADLEDAADKVAMGITSYAGQRCDAIKLVVVEEDIYDEFKGILVDRLKEVRVGDPRDPETDMGPLISEESAKAMIEAVEEAVKAGGRVLVGGRIIKGSYVEPTLVEVLDKDALRGLRLYRDEVFAPVALITSFKTLDEAIELANGRRFGLDAAIFGWDLARIRKLIRHLEVGAIYINEYPRHGIGYYPFGGRKDSGIGREGIGYSIEYVTAVKTIVYNYRGKGIWEYL